MDYMTIAIIVLFGGGGLLCVCLALYALLMWLLVVSSIMWLFGMSIYNIAAFWALAIGLPLFWKYVHDKEEKEQRKKAISQSNLA